MKNCFHIQIADKNNQGKISANYIMKFFVANSTTIDTNFNLQFGIEFKAKQI